MEINCFWSSLIQSAKVCNRADLTHLNLSKYSIYFCFVLCCFCPQSCGCVCVFMCSVLSCENKKGKLHLCFVWLKITVCLCTSRTTNYSTRKTALSLLWFFKTKVLIIHGTESFTFYKGHSSKTGTCDEISLKLINIYRKFWRTGQWLDC